MSPLPGSAWKQPTPQRSVWKRPSLGPFGNQQVQNEAGTKAPPQRRPTPPSSSPARSRQPQKATFPFLNVSGENSVKPGPKQVTNTLRVSCLGPTFTKNGPENVKNEMRVFESGINIFPYSFLLATPFCLEFQPLKGVVRIYKRRLPLQMSTVLPTRPPTYSPFRFGVPSATDVPSTSMVNT